MILRIALLSSMIVLFLSGWVSAQNERYDVDITVRITDQANKTAYLAHHYGDKQYLDDTLLINDKGVVELKYDSLPKGMYLFLFEDNSYFEFILNEPKFTLQTTRSNPVGDMKVTGSKENEVFFDDLKFIGEKRSIHTQLSSQLSSVGDDKEKKKAIKDQLAALDEEVKTAREKLMEDHPDLLYSKILKALQEVEVPDPPTDEEGNISDSTFTYRYYKKHFFDTFDFSDRRMLWAPVYHNKLKTYIENLTVVHPDSIKISCDYLIERSESDREMYKYTLIYLLNKYAKSKIMGMDGVYVHLVDNYYAQNKTWWVDSVTLFRMKDRASSLRPTLVGTKAPNMVLRNMSGDWVSLHSLKNEHVIVCIWDADCGHCKKTVPKLHKLYEAYKDQDLEIYAIATNNYEEINKVKKFIEEHNLTWINVTDPYFQSTFREDYDVQATPKFYLLDSKKIIKAKQVTVKQLDQILSELTGIGPFLQDEEEIPLPEEGDH